MPDQSIVLVDYDNASDQRERRPVDASLNIGSMLRRLVAHLKRLEMPAHVDVLLYGGWYTDEGLMTPRAEWLDRVLPDHRARLDGFSIRPRLMRAMASVQGRDLVGTYRNVRKPEQKMVDSMLTLDAAHFAQKRDLAVLVVSADRDVLPGILLGVRNRGARTKVRWLRSGDTDYPKKNDAHIKEFRCDIDHW